MIIICDEYSSLRKVDLLSFVFNQIRETKQNEYDNSDVEILQKI